MSRDGSTQFAARAISSSWVGATKKRRRLHLPRVTAITVSLVFESWRICWHSHRCGTAYDDHNLILLPGRLRVPSAGCFSRQASNFTEMWVQEQQCWRAAAQVKKPNGAVYKWSLFRRFPHKATTPVYSGAASDAGRP